MQGEDRSMSNGAELTAAMEDYLEAIYRLQREREVARVKDIASRTSRHT
jgi:Mn-dependent DtxR family transcriptional regulator